MTCRFAFPILALSLAAVFLTGCPSEQVATPGPDGSAADAKPDTAIPDTSPPEVSPPDAGPAGTLLEQLAQAQATWDAAKATCGTYHYANEHQHYPFGGCSKYGIEISDNQPTRRRGYNGAVGSCADAVEVEWEETGAGIGSHAGAAALTVEQLFVDCQHRLSSLDPAAYELELVIGPMGVPSTCGSRPRGCLDDCFDGFTLSGFACGPLPAPPTDGGARD